MKNLKSNIVNGLVWKLTERTAVQGIQFILQIVLARLLLPEDFGLIVVVTIFIQFANIFIQSGLNTALIQKKYVDEKDYSSVFYLSLFIAGILYIVLFFTSPFIALFFQAPELTIILRVLSITLFFGALNSIQNAFVAKNMLFKKLFISSFGAVLISGIVGITLAYAGFGVWALVWQQLINQLLVTIILWYTVRWRPKFVFSINRVKILFSYGWKLLVSSLIDTFERELRSLIIGKIYPTSMLGFYNRGEQFPKLIITNINGSIQSVMLPAIASQQEDRNAVKSMVRRSIKISSYIVFPLMVGLAVIAEPLINILMTEKWNSAVPFLQIFCASYALWPIHTANLQAINAIGRSDIFLKLEIIKKIIGFIILVVSIPFGVYAIALGVLISGIISSFINAYPNLKLINYSYKEQWNDIFPSISITLVMGVIVFYVKYLSTSDLVTIVLQIVIGVLLYVGLSKIFKLESYNYILSIVRELWQRRRKEGQLIE